MPTPVVYGDLLYIVTNNGVLAALRRPQTAQRLYQERIAGKGGAFSASPVAADGKLYFASEDGDVYVVKAGPKYELLATNAMGEVLMATPAISDGLIFVRGLRHVYAIGPSQRRRRRVAARLNRARPAGLQFIELREALRRTLSTRLRSPTSGIRENGRTLRTPSHG